MAVIGHLPLSAAPASLPAISGEFSGDFTPLGVVGAPKLHWTLAVESPDATRRARLDVTGPGIQAEIELQLAATGEKTWRLVQASTALKPWLNGAFTSGTATLSGGGQWGENGLSGSLTLEVKDLDLGELLRFSDAEKKYVRVAEGRVEGRIVVQLVNGVPEQFAASLGIVPGTVAVISFQPSPGLLTSYVPEAVRKHYPGLEAIELGRTPLEAKVLRLTTHPAGDAEGRSARVHVEGRPLDPKLIAPLKLDVNVSGPVENLLRKVLDSRLRIGGVK